MAYTDETEMPFGKFKGKRLIDVPAHYLIWWYETPSQYGKNPELLEYVKDNWNVLKKETEKK